MIQGSAIRPVEDRPSLARRCYRCGVDWYDARCEWRSGAPCKDCRVTLRKEGVDLDEYRRPAKRKNRAA